MNIFLFTSSAMDFRVKRGKLLGTIRVKAFLLFDCFGKRNQTLCVVTFLPLALILLMRFEPVSFYKLPLV